MESSSEWPYTPFGPVPTVREADGRHYVVLLSGYRHWDDPTAVEDVLDFLRPSVLIHGAAAGVDFIGDRWAKRRSGIIIEPFKIPQDWWDMIGRAAGPRRNGSMITRALEYEDAGHAILVATFPAPDSTGTIDLIEQSVAANLPVVRYQ